MALLGAGAQKVLLIYDSFPPEQSSGTGRPYSLYQNLEKYGIQQIVLTKNNYGKMPGERNVLRVNSLDTWRQTRYLLPYKLISWAAFRLGAISNDLVFYFAAKRILRRLAKEGIDLVYASFPYTNPLLLALVAKKRYGIPFIVEFRDGYLFEPLFGKNWLQQKRAQSFERKLIRESKCVVTIGKNLSAYFQSAYPEKKCHTVYNGYSQITTDSREEPAPPRERITIGYFGSFLLLRNKNRGIGRLVQGIRGAIRESGLGIEKLLFQFIGNFTESERSEFALAGIDAHVEFLPYMDRVSGFMHLARSVDYLLFVGVEGETTIVSAKLPEYLMLDKPILGVCAGNEAANIILDTGVGEVCGFEAIDIKELIMKAISGNLRYDPKENVIRNFDRRIQAGHIAEIMHSAMQDTGAAT